MKDVVVRQRVPAGGRGSDRSDAPRVQFGSRGRPQALDDAAAVRSAKPNRPASSFQEDLQRFWSGLAVNTAPTCSPFTVHRSTARDLN